MGDLRAVVTEYRATSTFTRYAGPWRKFKEWCITKQTSFLPASPLLVALYMMLLLRTATSPATVLTFLGAVYLYHTLAGYPSPIEHQLVCMAREVARRTKLSGQNAKKPFLAPIYEEYCYFGQALLLTCIS